MQQCIRRVACLSVLVGVLAMVTMTSAQSTKITKCCTMVSTKPITAPIIGYRIQKKMLPCVRAVIFETTEGEICSHFKEDWVFEKIMELNQARRSKNTTPATITITTSST